MPERPELDSCGIGLVADAHGRSSRTIVAKALEGLANLVHRGAVAADDRTGDGAGILTAIPAALFGAGNGVATLFVRGDDPLPAARAAAGAEGLAVIDVRVPATDPAALGDLARASAPRIVQVVLDPGTTDPDGRERAAYRFRRRLEKATAGTYVASASFRTVVYKGLVSSAHLADYFPDLADERFTSPFALFHQRFSTNTLPTWERAQPFRTLAHNGEINTLWGNENRLHMRATLGTEAAGLGPETLIRPVIDPSDSDSGKLDSIVELLLRGGRSLPHAVAMLVPEAWEQVRDLSPEVRGFYRYHSALMEPWDGPAGLVFTDGVRVGAALDRNGLRPMRVAICADGLVVVGSEAGAVDLTGHGTVERTRLAPGQMLVVDPAVGVQRDDTVKAHLGSLAPYAEWADDGFVPASAGEPLVPTGEDLTRRQISHGYTKELLAMVLKPMAAEAHEPTFSMGDDSPLANLAGTPRPVHHYLRQRFAQVTNPPIDPLRERLVMSLRTLLGPRATLLTETPEATHLLEFPSFFVYPSAVDALLAEDRPPFTATRLDATFAVADGTDGLRLGVERLRVEAVAAVAGGATVLVLDDGGIGPDRAPVPVLLAAGAVHQALVAGRLRDQVGLVVVGDDVRDVHYVAALLGFGADLICPRLALETVAAEADADDASSATAAEAQSRLRAALQAGVLKVLSKMGIATVDSYRSAQIFETVGLAAEVVDVCFTGTPATLGGVGWETLGADALALHASASWPADGYYRVRKGGEYHTHGKDVVDALNRIGALDLAPDGDGATSPDGTGGAAAGAAAARLGAPAPYDPAVAAAHLLQRAIAQGSDDLYARFAALVEDRPPAEPHDLLELVPAGPPVPLDEVEPAASIARRFSTGAMSHGSLSREAHENLARAMNLLGAKSNCGEGGEDPARFATRGQGRDDRNSRIKQIASGRFGVTPEYVAHADELQIKVAQGSKPGEGGQLPGHKVTPEIARLRHTLPGVELISPPPHHDIYSIEDLAQLIFDLKQVNAAQVNVKLVAEDGVGTIAAGCVKALADSVHISGANGGTGASPLTSIKHAGLPWEIGLTDTHQALMDNDLRSRAVLRVDGGFMTGRQVLIAALLGADEVSFGTAAMIAEGCIMLRACHKDTCKPGVATQRPALRANFTGTPEGVAAYFLFVAEEVRRGLAALGLRSFAEAVGRVEYLRQRTTGDPRADAMDLSPLLRPPADPTAPRGFVERVGLQDPRSELGDQVLADAFRALWDGDTVELQYPITTADRAVGAALSGAIALEFGMSVPPGLALVRFAGSAGQSFGAFLTHGVELDLVGEANDYVGKGMGGGVIAIRPPAGDAGDPVLAGNTCLYGATGGELYVAGSVGERFAVRNSGATAVVEGAGDHCAEYMTGGTVVVLGPVGYNLGAGMTGGQAFVYAPQVETLLARVNQDLVELERPDLAALAELRWLLERHRERTGSERARALLLDWDAAAEAVWHVVPKGRARRMEEQQARAAART